MHPSPLLSLSSIHSLSDIFASCNTHSISFHPRQFQSATVSIEHLTVPTKRVHGVPSSKSLIFANVNDAPTLLLYPAPLIIPAIIYRFPPRFIFETGTIAFDPVTQRRPTVRIGFDCWIGSDEGMEALALSFRISFNSQATVFIAHRYTCVARKRIRSTGLFVVPTRYVVQDEAEPLTSNHGIDTPLFRFIRSKVPRNAGHKQVQLTFSPSNFPVRTTAESVPGYGLPDSFSEEIEKE